MNSDLMKDASPGASGTVSESGWSNMQVFEQYLTKHFVSFVPGRSDSKTLVLLDGHRSHVALVLAEWAKQNNIILFILPSHTSHLLQPLDVACYGPFQCLYNTQSHKLMRQTSAAITKYNICQLACHVYTRALSSENLQSGFRRTGMFPLNKEIIPLQSLAPSTVFRQELSEEDSDTQSQDSTDVTVQGDIGALDVLN